ncbi:hypothetical protein BP6252_11044 [Coleophoma cylindrospora]|uniref:Uncharacterized protein n=1 Tax=Coleophoma cylindrospora TaxID=1849047 RepID=A0A3D8QNX7_9HELO|nr:hypothetical protein BP6252_11044 [Coleophoma cylindrospora]
MDMPSETPKSQPDAAPSSILNIDFSWKKFKARITENGKPSEPLYIVDFKTVKTPNVIFTSAVDNSTIGTGTLHPVSINADYELHGRQGKLKALKRFKTSYTHLSAAYSDTDELVPMTWTSSCSLTTWDFVCLDEQQNPVAKVTSNVWSLKKISNIEFLGPKADSPAARDEIVVTGLTLLFCMILRSNSLLSFFGAVFARPGPLEAEASAEKQKIAMGHDDH